jgi:MbtH protein
MENPFDDDSVSFIVLRNNRSQFSLWPSTFSVPEGWESIFGPASRPDCEEYVTEYWTEHARA